MGSSNSTTMKSKSTTNVTNNFMQSMNTDVKNSNSAELDMTQTLTFKAPFATMKDCNLTIEQNQKGTLRATMDAMANLTEEQTVNLAAEISNAQESALEQSNSGLAITPSDNEATVDQEIENNVTNNLTMAINKTFENMNYATGSQVQDATIDLYGMQCEGSNILINQNQALEVVAENLAETIADSVQSGEAVTKVKNEQTAKVKQSNSGVGASGSSGSSSSCISVIVLGVGAAVASGAIPMPEGGGFKRGGSEPNPVSAEGGMNKGMLIGILVVGFAVLALISFLIYYYTPEVPCPGEEDCNKAWDEIKASKPRVPAELLRKYHNCRIRHRARGIKPEFFRPNCESYCAHATRESTTPGLPSNPLTWLFCLGDLGGEEEEEEEEEKTGEDEPETFVNYKTKPLPEGYGNYY